MCEYIEQNEHGENGGYSLNGQIWPFYILDSFSVEPRPMEHLKLCVQKTTKDLSKAVISDWEQQCS